MSSITIELTPAGIQFLDDRRIKSACKAHMKTVANKITKWRTKTTQRESDEEVRTNVHPTEEAKAHEKTVLREG